MLIDFSTINQLIPKDGRLILTFSKKMIKAENETEEEKVKEINVVFAQLFKGKENDNDFSPIIITGSIDELNESFESMVTDIGQDQEKLARLKALPIKTKIDTKKKQLSSAIQKASKTAAPADKNNEGGKKDEPKKEAVKEAPKKPQMVDLFASLQATPPPPSVAVVNPPPESPFEELTVVEPEEQGQEEAGTGGAE